MITVKAIEDSHFEVTVQSRTTTTHHVTVSPDYSYFLTAGKLSTLSLIEKSFEFLLSRESNTSILRRFDLSVIANYFPEYESAIKKTL